MNYPASQKIFVSMSQRRITPEISNGMSDLPVVEGQNELPTVLRPLGCFEEFFWLLDQHRPIRWRILPIPEKLGTQSYYYQKVSIFASVEGVGSHLRGDRGVSSEI
jgi:hypothetical protein